MRKLHIMYSENKLILQEKQKEKLLSKWTALRGVMWSTETLLVVILRGEAHRIYNENVRLRNITCFHGACAEVITYTRVSEEQISQSRFSRKSLILDRITCRVITPNFTPKCNKFWNWVHFQLRQMSRNSPPLKGLLCKVCVPKFLFEIGWAL